MAAKLGDAVLLINSTAPQADDASSAVYRNSAESWKDFFVSRKLIKAVGLPNRIPWQRRYADDAARDAASRLILVANSSAKEPDAYLLQGASRTKRVLNTLCTATGIFDSCYSDCVPVE